MIFQKKIHTKYNIMIRVLEEEKIQISWNANNVLRIFLAYKMLRINKISIDFKKSCITAIEYTKNGINKLAYDYL